MNRKKLLSVMLAGAIIATQLVGCGTKKSETVKEAAKEPLKFSMSISANKNQYAMSSPDISNDKWVKELDKRANIQLTLRLIDHDKFSEQQKLMFASGDIPDVVWTFGDWKDARLSGSVEAGVFLPVDELLAKNKDKLTHLMKAIPEQAWKEAKTTFDQKTYSIPVTYLSVPALNGTFMRKDLLDKYSLKIPTTLDETLNVLRTFKKNGMQYPYIGREKWSYTTTFFETFGVAVNRWNLNDKGEMIPDIISPKMKEALKFHADLIKEGLMDPESLTTNSSNWTTKIQSGKEGAIFTHQVQGLNGWNVGIKPNVADGKFVLIPAIVGPNGAKGSTASPTISNSVLINKNFKDPERILEFLDWEATDEGQEFFAFGIDGQDYTKKDGKIQYTPPTDVAKTTENGFRAMLGVVGDASFNKLTMPFTPGGDEMLKFFQTVSPKEGYHAYKTDSKMASIKAHPDLNPDGCDLFYEYAAKIALGKIPVDDFDKFVAEYLKRGGNELIKEATASYKAGTNIKY